MELIKSREKKKTPKLLEKLLYASVSTERVIHPQEKYFCP